MAVEAVSARKFGPDHWEITVTDDGTTLVRKVEIPSPLPEQFANKKEYLTKQASRSVKWIRASKADAAMWDEETVTVTNQPSDAADILADIQGELDA